MVAYPRPLVPDYILARFSRITSHGDGMSDICLYYLTPLMVIYRCFFINL